jgi:hypothetical protein
VEFLGFANSEFSEGLFLARDFSPPKNKNMGVGISEALCLGVVASNFAATI